MTKHPFYNAATAFLYIVSVVGFLRVVGFFASDTPDNEILAPIGALSLLVLSVATMAFLFFYAPLSLLLKGNEGAAVHYLLKTIGYFTILASLTFLLILATT